MPVPRAKVSAGRNRWLRLQEYTDQARAVLLGQFAGELQDASRLGMPIDEDDDFSERSLALVWLKAAASGGGDDID